MKTCSRCERDPAEVVRAAIENHLDLDLITEHEEAEGRERIELLRALPRGDE